MGTFFGVLAGLTVSMLAVLTALRTWHYNALLKDYSAEIAKALENRRFFLGTVILSFTGASFNIFFSLRAIQNSSKTWYLFFGTAITAMTAICVIIFVVRSSQIAGAGLTSKTVAERLVNVHGPDRFSLLLQFARRKWQDKDLAGWEAALNGISAAMSSLLDPHTISDVKGHSLSLKTFTENALQNEHGMQEVLDQLIELSAGSPLSFESYLIEFLGALIRKSATVHAYPVALHATTQLVIITFRRHAEDSAPIEQGSSQTIGLFQIAKLFDWALQSEGVEIGCHILHLLSQIAPLRTQGADPNSQLTFRRLLPLCSLLWHAALSCCNLELANQTLLLLRRIGYEIPTNECAGLLVSRLEELGRLAANSNREGSLLFVKAILVELALVMPGRGVSDPAEREDRLIERAVHLSYAHVLRLLSVESREEIRQLLMQSGEPLLIDIEASGLGSLQD